MKRKRVKYKVEVRAVTRFRDELVVRKKYLKYKKDVEKYRDNIIHDFYYDKIYNGFNRFSEYWSFEEDNQLIIFYVHNR